MVYVSHFNQQSARYLQYRPTYPKRLYEYLQNIVGKDATVWDCATGNGQAALALTNYFKNVIATDLNPAQLEKALVHPQIEYRQCSAEESGLASESIDLITIAQALHWFNLEGFYQEALRVLKPNGWIAAWCYTLGEVNPDVDALLHKLYYQILGDTYWPPERRYIDEAYRTIYFPFKRHYTPEFFTEKTFDYYEFLGYLSTWSAIKEYYQRNQVDPLSLIADDLHEVWGGASTQRVMRWPIHLIMAEKTHYLGERST